ncbi:MAG: glycosyltransferase [Proteobacteria bacterium]|nr:glycosyltransferase [Pseudomonadota bacterium]MBU1389508.1 glycosyltransferase [Pseudomonadota bacterium]MBU1541328.1 glycosyltransferase [Pseudomonadota bacterium]MBU2429807.1 glycosyltransferase [Pseudomonadota bacterium]MBU2480565.1 glycosyltransferase [Pseudomonadota bacterium]
MIKVLHLITSLDTGGAEKMLFKLLSGMDRKQFENRVVCLLSPGSVEKQITDLGIKVETLNLKRGRISFGGILNLIKMIKKWHPDIIQTWLYHADLLGYLAARLTGIKNLIWNIRCTRMELEKYSRVTAWTVKACAFFSSYPVSILANSDMAKDQHIHTYGYNNKKFQIILNGFDLSVFKPDREAGKKIRQELDIPEDSMCVGLVGRYDPQKDHLSFIRAASIVTQRFPDMIFVLAGKNVDMNNSEIIYLIKEMKLNNNFRLLGERSDIPDIMNAMNVYCSSSAFGEGFPNVVGEAMACGLPCVVTDIGQSASIVDHTGFVVRPGNHDELADSIIKLTSLPGDQLKKLGEEARERVAKYYSLEKIVKEYENLYLTIADLNC